MTVERALVTGTSGFVGGALARRLAGDGVAVRGFARSATPELVALGVEEMRGDLADLAAVERAVAGVNVVFHVAAKAGVWGRPRAYERTNVLGTEHVLAACRRHGVGRLVYTSSPSVVFAGEDQSGIDETVPYPRRHLAHYPRTKALAEQRVLAAHDGTLATVALRPHLIWGPGDRHLVPRILARARAGTLRLVGDGTNRVDSSYIDDVVAAHLAAAQRLDGGSPVAGKAYFISQGEPLPMRELIDRILDAGGLPPVTGRVPAPVAYGIGALLESVYALTRRTGEPPMTRFVARQLATEHWFDLTAARRDLGYRPAVSIDEGMARLAAWLRRREQKEEEVDAGTR